MARKLRAEGLPTEEGKHNWAWAQTKAEQSKPVRGGAKGPRGKGNAT